MSGGEVLGQAARGSSARNAPCPCGSGKKYKLCCLPKGAMHTVATGLPVPRLLEIALRHHLLGDIRAAQAGYQHVLTLSPRNPDALHLLGVTEEQAGNHRRAIELLSAAIYEHPTAPDYYRNLAVSLRSVGELTAAVGCLRAGIAQCPRHGPLFRQLGETLHAYGDPEAAVAALREAICLDPGDTQALTALGNVLTGAGAAADAVPLYEQAIALNPRDAGQYNSMGLALEHLGRFPEAITAFEAGRQLAPHAGPLEMHLIHAQQQICTWEGFQELGSDVRDAVRNNQIGLINPFDFLTIPSSGLEQLACAAKWTELCHGLAVHTTHSDFPKRGGADRRLHIGYLSADFHEHATSSLLAEVLERHDRRRVTISAYALDGDDGSAMRQRLVGAVDQWVDLSHATHAAAAARIAADEVDILVDLKGYTFQARTEIVALRPAPVQVNYLGYPGTMGAPFIDYLVADEFVIPPAHLGQYRERVAYLPVCYQPNDRQRRIAATPTRAACGLPERGVVLCSFSGTYKITPAVYAVWLRLLGAVPESVLWLLGSNAWAMANLRAAAAAAGVAPERVVFAPRLAGPEHLARQRVADLFLDTHPVTGHTTCSDALWAGLPVVTCAGGTFVSRVAGSLLRAVGLPELVTESLAAYEAVALELAREPDRLGAVRARLAANRLTSPLFDSAGYTVALEGLYEGMWAAYVRTGQPAGDSRDPLRIEALQPVE